MRGEDRAQCKRLRYFDLADLPPARHDTHDSSAGACGGSAGGTPGHWRRRGVGARDGLPAALRPARCAGHVSLYSAAADWTGCAAAVLEKQTGGFARWNLLRAGLSPGRLWGRAYCRAHGFAGPAGDIRVFFDAVCGAAMEKDPRNTNAGERSKQCNRAKSPEEFWDFSGRGILRGGRRDGRNWRRRAAGAVAGIALWF